MTHEMTVVETITPSNPREPDTLFITCGSFEERCLGVPRRLSERYQFQAGYVFVYDDPNEDRDDHLQEMQGILEPKGPVKRISTSEGDPSPAIAQLVAQLKQSDLSRDNAIITLDMTTFTKRHLLLMLRTFDDLGLWDTLRIYYTEPQDYVADLYLPMSFGIRSISHITGFIGHAPLTRPSLLIIFLGYEGDRAAAIYETMDPTEVLLVVPKPAYHPEWEGRTEEMNKHLIQIIGEDRVRYAHSEDPLLVAKQLEKDILSGYDLHDWRGAIAPLGTKPQALGLYLFWRKHRGKCSVIYAQPLEHNERFFSEGVGRTLALLTPAQP